MRGTQGRQVLTQRPKGAENTDLVVAFSAPLQLCVRPFNIQADHAQPFLSSLVALFLVRRSNGADDWLSPLDICRRSGNENHWPQSLAAADTRLAARLADAIGPDRRRGADGIGPKRHRRWRRWRRIDSRDPDGASRLAPGARRLGG